MSVRLNAGKYFGEAVSQRATPHLTLTESVYPPKAMLQRHSHERPYFCLVVRGDFAETSERGTQRYCPSEVIFHPSGEDHADQIGGNGARCFSVEMDEAWICRAADRPAVEPKRAISGRGALSWIALRMYSEFQNPDRFSPLAIDGLSLLLLAEFYREASQPEGPIAPRWLREVRDRLDSDVAASYALAELARGAGVHEVHLAREFQRFFGSPVGEYVRRRRVESACSALGTSNRALGQIALEVGFADQAHFTRTFKRVTGLTPRAYRSAVRAR
jgi:AraC family transcriptional regulator